MGLEKIRAFTDHSALENVMHKTPIAKVSVSGNPEWTDGAITVDATANTITIVGHGLVNTDRVVFLPLVGALTDLPGGIRGGFTYFVVGVSGDAFQVSLTSGGAAIDITSVGTPAKYKIEKAVVTTLTITGLNTSNCKVFACGGISSVGTTYLTAAINNISAGYYMSNAGDAAVGSMLLQMYSSAASGYYVSMATNFYFRNGRLNYFNENGLCVASNNSTITQIDRITPRTVGGFTISNTNFNPITRIDYSAYATGCYLLNGFTVEVYSA